MRTCWIGRCLLRSDVTKYIAAAIFMLLLACTTVPDAAISLPPAIAIERTNPALQNQNGVWLFRNEPFNGYIIEKEQNQVVAKLPVYTDASMEWHKAGMPMGERNTNEVSGVGIGKVYIEDGIRMANWRSCIGLTMINMKGSKRHFLKAAIAGKASSIGMAMKRVNKKPGTTAVGLSITSQ